ncbi:MAG: ABC transporter permease [Acidimicrobiia bacterium]|nr:ABC transporter permease [Acidimicrobiia bacterium]
MTDSQKTDINNTTATESGFPRVPLETDAAAAEEVTGPESGLWRDAWRQLIRNPAFIVGGLLILGYAFMALFPQVIAPQGTGRALCDTGAGAQPPSREFIFGLDEKGCPYYPRVIYGVRPSLIIGPSVAVFSLTIALIFGTIAGYYGKFTDTVIARITDVFLALPTILAALVFITAFRNASPDDPTVSWPLRFLSGVFEVFDDFTGVRGIGLVVFILTLLGWTTMLRLARSSALSTKNADYVEAARALGASDFRIMTRHILPNSLAPVLVYATITVGVAIVAEATLSFLGVGLKVPAVSWGLQLSVAQGRLQNDPHLMFFPGIFLAGLVFSFILIGDAVRDALDPKLR